MTDLQSENLTRYGMAAVGAIAGFAVWLLLEVLPDAVDNEWLLLWLGSSVFAFFSLLLGLVGPLKPKDALGVAGVLGLSASALWYWASQRYAEFDDVFEAGFEPAAYPVLLFIGAPFGAALMRGRLWDYAYLFDTAWGIVVRYLAAWVFVGLFWAAVFLSNALLEIVGISIIWDVVEEEVVAFTLSGLVLGLALAVANELRAYVSPYLLLRLLRLLMPPLVLVVVVFILALPFRGLSGLFGEFSAAGTLMAVALAGASLIAAAVDSSEEEAAKSRLMQLATLAFAAMLPILGVLAVWAIAIRVGDYGWTPTRLSAFVAALFVLAYGVLYGHALLRKDWRARIRRANIYHALAVLAVAALWLTPILDASRISANTQVSRFINGKSTLEELPAWEIVNGWGKAGHRAAERLRALDEEDYPGLTAVMKRAETESKWAFQRENSGPSKAERIAKILTTATVYPVEFAGLDQALEGLQTYHIERIEARCVGEDCVFVVGDLGAQPGMQVVFFAKDDARAEVELLSGEQESLTDMRFLANIDVSMFQEVKAGNFQIAPSSMKSIWVGDKEIAPAALANQFLIQSLK